MWKRLIICSDSFCANLIAFHKQSSFFFENSATAIEFSRFPTLNKVIKLKQKQKKIKEERKEEKPQEARDKKGMVTNLNKQS